jgi:phosphate uptake regulator
VRKAHLPEPQRIAPAEADLLEHGQLVQNRTRPEAELGAAPGLLEVGFRRVNARVRDRLRVDLPRTGEEAQGMLREGLGALVNGDEVRARVLIEQDDQIDALYDRISRALLTYMMEDPRNIFRATRLPSIAHNLERVSDHATNTAEMVVFYVKGTDIRHGGM